MRSILFCNEMLGLGHLRLSLVLAEALVGNSDGSTALVVTGSPAFGGMQVAPGVDILKLPSAPVTLKSAWRATAFRPAAGLAIGDEAAVALRTQLLLTAVDQFRPNIVVSDQRPLGREQELRPALEYLRAQGSCTIALGLLDVDDEERIRFEWNPKLLEAMRSLYDLALVYGPLVAADVRVERLRDVGVPVYHIGLVGAPPANHGASDLGEGYLLAIAGGGVDGFEALNAVVGAIIGGPPLDVPTVLVTGPLMAQSSITMLRKRATGLAVRVLEYRNDIVAVIAGARAVIAMAGYCTVAEVLASGKPAILVPRTFPRKEQLNRARRLVAAGRVGMLLPNELDPPAVRRAIDELLKHQPKAPEPLTGAAEAARFLARAAHAWSSDCSMGK